MLLFEIWLWKFIRKVFLCRKLIVNESSSSNLNPLFSIIFRDHKTLRTKKPDSVVVSKLIYTSLIKFTTHYIHISNLGATRTILGGNVSFQNWPMLQIP